LKKAIIEELLRICRSLEYEQADGEDDTDYLARVLPKLASALVPERRMSPTEAVFFEMADITQKLLFKELGFEPKEIQALFKDSTSESRAKKLAALMSGNASEAGIIHERMFASQFTIHQVEMHQVPFPKEMEQAFKRVLKINPFDGEGPKEIGGQYIPIMATELDSKTKTYCVTMARTVVVDTHINNAFIAEDVARVQAVHIIVDPHRKTAEFRGPISQKSKAMKAFLDLAKVVKPGVQATDIVFDRDDAHELIARLNARGREVVIKNDAGAQSGVGTTTLKVDPAYKDVSGQNDLYKSEDYKRTLSEMSDEQRIFSMSVEITFDGQTYKMDISPDTSSIRFPEATVTSSAIRTVTGVLNEIHREKVKKKGAAKTAPPSRATA
jgi:hypothetical protein